MKRIIAIALLLFLSCYLTAEQFSSKSTGLTSIPEIKDLQQVEDILREHARALDFIQRSLHADIDSINRDEIPALEASIALTDNDFDIPLIKDSVFSWDAGNNEIDWTAGELAYGGTTYTVSAGSSDAHATKTIIVYVDVGNLSEPLTLLSNATGSLSITSDYWILCIRRASDAAVFQTLQSPVIHGGLIQANTITADEIAANAITASEADLTDIFAQVLNLNGYLIGGGISNYADDSPANNFFLGDAGGVYNYAFKVYNSATNYIKFDDDAGLRIAGDLAINGNCTFTADYDPTLKVDDDGAAADVNGGATKINGGMVLISGAVDLDDWRHGSDATKIDGGDIYTNTVTATQINVGTLSAISADLGTVTAGSLTANTIDTGTLTLNGSTMTVATGDISFVDTYAIGNFNAGGEGSKLYSESFGAPSKTRVRYHAKEKVSTSWWESHIGGNRGISAINMGILNYVRTSAWPGEQASYITLDVGYAHAFASAGKFGMDIGLADDPMIEADANGATLGYDATRKITVNSSGVVTVPEECITGGTAAVADNTYVVYNDGSTSGQVTSITTVNGIITAIAVIP